MKGVKEMRWENFVLTVCLIFSLTMNVMLVERHKQRLEELRQKIDELAEVVEMADCRNERK